MRNEILRKAMHIVVGTASAYLIYYDILRIWMLLVLLFGTIACSYLVKRRHVPLLSRLYEIIDKDEMIPGQGAITFMLGILISYILFYEHTQILCASIMVLSLGDGMAALIGRQGITRISGQKTAEGTLAGIIGAFLGASLFLNPFTALIGSSLAMIIEAALGGMKRSFLDDNLILPLISGLIFYVF